MPIVSCWSYFFKITCEVKVKQLIVLVNKVLVWVVAYYEHGDKLGLV